MRRIISVLMENAPGALSRIVGVFSQRGYNVDSFGANYAKSMGTHSVSLDVDKNQSKKINIDISKFIPKLIINALVMLSPSVNIRYLLRYAFKFFIISSFGWTR